MPRPRRNRRRRTLQRRPSRPTFDDLAGDHLGVFADAIEDRRLALPHPVDAHEVEAGHLRPAVRLDREPHAVDDWEFHPSIIRPVSARPDHASDSILSDVQLRPGFDSKGRRQIKRWRSSSTGSAARLDELQEIDQPRIAEVDARGEVGGETELGAVGADIPPEQLDTHRVQHAEIQVPPAVMSAGLRVAEEPRHRRGKLVRSTVHVARLDHPPDCVMAIHPSWHPDAPATREEYLAARLVNLFRQLAPGLPAPYDHDGTWRQGGWIRVFLGEELHDVVGEQFRTGGTMGALVCTGCYDYRTSLDLVRGQR